MRSVRTPTIVWCTAALLLGAGCGSDPGSTGPAPPPAPADRALRAGARSLEAAASRTRSVLADVGPDAAARRLAARLLAPQLRQTRDVITLLGPTARGSAPVTELVAAAREQERFLREVIRAATTSDPDAAVAALEEATATGERAVRRYSALTLLPGVDLAGDLPPATAFDVDAFAATLPAQGD